MDPFQQPQLDIDIKTSPSLLTRLLRFFALSIIVLIGACSFGYYVLVSAPSFEGEQKLVVHPGDSLKSISVQAEQIGIVKSKMVFQTAMFILGGDRNIKAGSYTFSSPMSAIEVAVQIAGGKRNISQNKITIPEGFTREQMADVFKSKIAGFDTSLFLQKTKEGFLFPDTYIFLEDTKTLDVVSTLQNEFEKKTKPLQEEMQAKHLSMNDTITMASIIEKEATGENDRGIISGILWKRYKMGMPLQVDATILFATHKNIGELSSSDFKIESPYNTYKTKGLPPGPICSPGLSSIKASLEPVESSYLYYLHDKEGNVHFAKTFEEHKKNIALYL